MIDRGNLQIGTYVAALNNMFIDCQPYGTPLVITKIAAKRITAQRVLPANRDPEMWDPSDRYLKTSDIIAVYKNLEEATEAHTRAREYYESYSAHITELEGKRARAVRAALQRVL